jgi:hypothetical protein
MVALEESVGAEAKAEEMNDEHRHPFFFLIDLIRQQAACERTILPTPLTVKAEGEACVVLKVYYDCVPYFSTKNQPQGLAGGAGLLSLLLWSISATG